MKTVLQTIIDNKNLANEKDKLMIDEFAASYVFFIDNISNYFYEISDQDYWDIEKDYPNLAPPIESMWFEWSFPKTINVSGKIEGMPSNMPSIKCALYLKSLKLDDHWHLMGIPTLMINNSVTKQPYIIQWQVNLDGSYKVNTYGIITDKTVSNKNDLLEAAGIFIHPVCLALSFMHCRNVKIVENGKGIRSGRDRYSPSFRYHIIEIEPIKKLLQDTSDTNKTGIKQSLHICRGHFKDYRNGQGLFGKYKEVYWWDQQMRGNIEYGYTDKDYKLK